MSAFFSSLRASPGKEPTRGAEQAMMRLRRGGALAAILLLAATTISACDTTDNAGAIAADNQPGQVAPVADSSVSSNSLPPIPGASSSTQVAGTDQASTGAIPTDSTPGSLSTAGATQQDTASTAGWQSNAAAPNSFVSLNDVGQVSNTPGRNLTGGLTVEKLLGGWNVVSGTSQCRLNLTYTSTTSTGGGNAQRYRASSPACQIPTLAGVASWQLAGTQVQLFDKGNNMLGTLLLSGNHFIGTLQGGRAISMTG
jgi:predicted small secreted protein